MVTELDDDSITRDPDIMAGKAVVRGTRIPVDTVLGYLQQNPDLKELLADYPRLTAADVQACIAYARSAMASYELSQTPS